MWFAKFNPVPQTSPTLQGEHPAAAANPGIVHVPG